MNARIFQTNADSSTNGEIQRAMVIHVSRQDVYEALARLIYSDGRESIYSKIGMRYSPETALVGSKDPSDANQVNLILDIPHGM